MAAEIVEIKEHFQASWHDQLDAWAATAHMIRTGPIMQLRPSSPSEDPEVREARDEVDKLERQRADLIREAKATGIAWIDEPPCHRPAGMFGNPQRED